MTPDGSKPYLIYSADDREIADELIWFYNSSDSACGMRSNWGVGNPTGSTWEDPYTEAVLHAIKRKRKIDLVLRSLSRTHQRVLEVAYGHKRIPAIIAQILGDQLAPVALCVADDITAIEFIKLCSRMYSSTATEADEVLMNRIRREARKLRDEVTAAYKRALNAA